MKFYHEIIQSRYIVYEEKDPLISVHIYVFTLCLDDPNMRGTTKKKDENKKK